MGFNNVLGGDRIITYTYDNYGLYATTVSEQYKDGTANTSYVYDYITGDLLKETLPDGSDTQYTYYSDGKIKTRVSPLTQYPDGRTFYTIEQYQYNSNAICRNYKDETPIFDVEQVSRYRVFTDDRQAEMYSADINFYDSVGNLKMNQKYDFSKKDENNSYLRYYTKYYHDNYDRLVKTVDNENHSTDYAYDEWDRMSGYSDGTNNFTYEYDANGIRTQKNDKQYVVDIKNNVVAETDSTGAVTEEVLWGHQPLARKTNGNWYYYIYNAHGDVVGLVDDSGMVVNS